MNELLIFLFFIFGTIFGSFFNVVGLRVPEKTFFDQERSYCPHCKKTLHWFELIPIVSYLLQKGQCRGCHNKISPIYPLMEFAAGVGFVLSYVTFGIHLELLFALLLVSMAVIITVSDLRYQKIPNKILLFFFPIFFLWRILFPINPWWSSIIGALVGFTLLFIIIVVSKGGMGIGDLKYFTLLGFVFGWQQLLLLFLLSTFYGTVINLILLVLKKVTRKSRVPFGPYISLAAVTVLFYGETILQWYLGLF